jgi:hypothetical protein
VLLRAINVNVKLSLLFLLSRISGYLHCFICFRSFLQDPEPSALVLIVQMDLEEHCSDELIASAK